MPKIHLEGRSRNADGAVGADPHHLPGNPVRLGARDAELGCDIARGHEARGALGHGDRPLWAARWAPAVPMHLPSIDLVGLRSGGR